MDFAFKFKSRGFWRHAFDEVIHGLIIFLLCLWIFATSSSAMLNLGAAGGGTADCDQVQAPTEDGASVGSYSCARVAADEYMATKFVYTGTTIAICAVDTWNDYDGSNPHTYTMAIYTHDSGNNEPDTLVTNATSDSQDPSGIGASEVVVSWTFPTPPTLTNGVTYWLVIYSDTNDVDHHMDWHLEGAGATERVMDDDDGLGTWALNSSTTTLKFKLYSQ
jgi:hypothetical protein